MASREFLLLPNEIRHLIYKAYFTLEDGYAFQSGSGKLAAADGQPLDLALMYTCRLIASETKNLPLELNVVSFSTVYHPEWRRWAGRFDYLLRTQHLMQTHILAVLGNSGHITPAIYEEVGERFPWFVAALKDVVNDPQRIIHTIIPDRYLDGVACYREWSLYRTTVPRDRVFQGTTGSRYEITHAVKFTLRLVAQQLQIKSGSDLGEFLVGWRGWKGDRQDLIDFLDECYEPWDMPSWSDLESMGRRLEDDDKWSRLQLWEVDDWKMATAAYRSKYRFSAAAVAIRFLRHLPLGKRLSLRAMLLREDHIAVGFQECHSNGLIPFLQENPRLRVEHRVSMLTNIIQAASMLHDVYLFILRPEEQRPSINGNWVFQKVSDWSVEALATVDAGMPTGFYSLIIDGEPAINLCSEVFQQSVQRSRAFFIAVETCFPRLLERHSLTALSLRQRRAVEALTHLTHETSVIRCNFNPGQLWDIDRFVKDFEGLAIDTDGGLSELNHKYKTSEESKFHLPIPPSSWVDLMMDNWESREILTYRDRREAGMNPKDVPPIYGSRVYDTWRNSIRASGHGASS
ncbi:hypothetical protein FMUND_14415 [Fusarium mundagurra]|uniref:Uncharacterized protein n=1 Tax=Fusarium mundagurra TaxID=1567541 RepID=A0A8H6D1H4_9HYPO|nr:hypothetical protein FMUND_14415 [Fusarium mundagurra]